MVTALKAMYSAIAVMMMAPSVFAQPMREDAGGARFDVSGYAVEGRNLLRAEDFTRIIAPFIGRQKATVDVARARDALQQAYHDLGHCSTRVTLSRPMPQDGVVTFSLVEVNASEIRDCLPVVVLDERKTPGPPIRAAAVAGVMAYPYMDVRDSPESPPRSGSSIAAKIDSRITTPSATREPLHLAPVQGAQAPVILQTSTDVGAVQPKVMPTSGVIALPHVEGRSNAGLMLTMNDATPAAPVLPLIVAQAQPQTAKPILALPAAPASTAAPLQPPHAAPKPAAEKPPVQVAQAPPAGAPAEVPPVAPPAPVASPKFEIQRYLVEGNTLLTRERVEQVLARYTGKDKDFGDVQRALEALQTEYKAAGYGGVEVRLPEQELDRGDVKFIVIEVKIAKILVEGNEHFSKENVRRSVPSLREGVTPNSGKIAASVRLANENPAKQLSVLLRGSEREDQVDAVIKVADVDPRRWSVSLDNTGNQNTGRARIGVGYQNANFRDWDHIMTLQFITSPTKFKDVSVYGFGYKIPLYSLGDSIEFVAGYSNVDSGVVQDLFLVSGQGTVYGVRYNQTLPKWGDLEHKLIYGLDYRAYQNQVTPEGSPDTLVPDLTVHPFSLTYSASLKGAAHELTYYLNFAQNIPGGNDGVDEDFKKLGARFGVGTQGYRLFRAGFNYVRAFKTDVQVRANFSAQYTDDALIAPEQFGIGGADSIRGFNERYASNDKGYRTSVEVYTPDYGKRFGLGDGRLRFLMFYDTGALRRNYTQSQEQEAVNLDSAGVGLRLSLKNSLTARLDVANVFHDGSGYSEPDNRRNIKKFHLSVSWVW